VGGVPMRTVGRVCPLLAASFGYDEWVPSPLFAEAKKVMIRRGFCASDGWGNTRMLIFERFALCVDIYLVTKLGGELSRGFKKL
jgi:hypothetical protein